MPWVWTRRQLAQAWHVPPWVIDEAPIDEVLLELELMGIEAQALRWRQQHRPR
ncbi:MAG TPA: hypothetical protein VII06_09615 [Chloroflexota bacterium]